MDLSQLPSLPEPPVKRVMVAGLEVTVPALIVASIGLLTGLAVVLIHPNMVPVGLIVVASTFLQAYNINCAVVGKCNAWAWVLGGLFILHTAVSLYRSFRSGHGLVQSVADLRSESRRSQFPGSRR